MHSNILSTQILFAALLCVLVYVSSCTKPKPTVPLLPLKVMHKLTPDTLKVLTKGSPPFVLRLSKNDSIVSELSLAKKGIMSIPIKHLRKAAGDYDAQISSRNGDTSFVVQIKKEVPKKVVAKKQKKQRRQKSQQKKNTAKLNNNNPQPDWTKWKRSDCYYEIWYRYRCIGYSSVHKAYKFYYELYNGYRATVIFRSTVTESSEQGRLQSMKDNGGDLFSATDQFTLRPKQYARHKSVILLTPNVQLFIWRLQSPNPVSPYIDCDN